MRGMLRVVVMVSAGLLMAGRVWCADAEYVISEGGKAPEGVSAEVVKVLVEKGLVLSKGEDAVCRVWLAKQLPVKKDFKPTLSVKYPLLPGELVGVIEVTDKSEFTDFRGQQITAGVYTLRYGQQPTDGNHVGTSDLADFLVAIPAKGDVKPARVEKAEDLHAMSKEASGTNHPAIMSLLPVEKAFEKSQVEHVEEKNLWVLQSLTENSEKGKLSIRLVLVGQSEG